MNMEFRIHYLAQGRSCMHIRRVPIDRIESDLTPFASKVIKEIQQNGVLVSDLVKVLKGQSTVKTPTKWIAPNSIQTIDISLVEEDGSVK